MIRRPPTRARSTRAGLLAVPWMVFWAPPPAPALDPGKPLHQAAVETWDEREHLPHGSVVALAQTATGFVWAATPAGLVRLDGRDIEVWDRRRSPELPSARLSALEPTGRGDGLWVGTHGGGLWRFEAPSFTRVPGDLPAEGSVWDLVVTAEGELWVGGPDGVRVLPTGAEVLSTVLSGVRARSLHAGADGRIWVGAEEAILVGDRAGLEPIPLPEGIEGPLVRIPGIDPEGAIWVTDEPAATTWRLLPPDHRRAELVPGVDGSMLIALAHDRHGSVWHLTDGRGLRRWGGSPEASEHLTRRDGLGSDVALAWLEDRHGDLWVGTDGGGLSRIRERRFEVLTPLHGLSGAHVLAVLQASDGTLWVGTAGDGLNRVLPGEIEILHAEDGLDNEFVYALAEDDAERIWIATCHGVVLWEDGRLRTPAGTTDLFNECVRALLVDRRGNVWAGSDLGLYRIGVEAGERVDPGRQVQIRVLLEDRRGRLWAGGDDGLFRLDGDRLRAVAGAELAGTPVTRLHEDGDGVLWIGTSGGGLQAFVDGRLGRISTAEGLPDDRVAVLLEDRDRRFWIGGNHGLARVGREELLAVAEGRRRDVEPLRLGTAEGLPSRQLSGGFQSAGAVAADGRLWFPTLRGLAGIDPRSPDPEPPTPRILIEDLQIDGEPTVGPAIRLEPGRHEVSLRLVAPDFTTPGQLRYRYRIEGLDRAWRETAHPAITFAGLPPGGWILRARARLPGGSWSPEPATLRIEQLPAFHQRPVFPVLVLVVGAAGVAIGHRWRTAHLRRRSRELEVQVNERTRELDAERRRTERQAERLRELDSVKNRFFVDLVHELRTPLTLLLGPLEQLLDRLVEPRDRRDLTTAERSGRRLIELVDEILSLARLEAGELELRKVPCDLEELLRRQRALFASWAAKQRIEIVLAPTTSPSLALVDRASIEKVIANLLANAIRHTPPGGRIDLGIVDAGSDRIGFRVGDTGPGVPPEERERIFDRFYRGRTEGAAGIGLALVRELVAAHGGELGLGESPDGGAEFRVLVSRAAGSDATAATGEGVGARPRPEPEPPASAGAAPDAVHRPIEGGRPLLLLVDDDPELLEFLTASLEELFEVDTAANGQIGLERIEAREPDLVISDVVMPIVDGFELCRRLRSRDEWSHVPLILLSGRGEAEDRLRGLEIGADDYVAKPFGVRELTARARRLVESRRRLRRRLRELGVLAPEAGAATPLDERFLQRLVACVRSRFHDPGLGVAELAQDLALSPRHLQRKLNALVGESPRAFLRRQRLAHARELLRRGAANVSEAAYAVGFSEPSAFSRAFRKAYGEPPSDILAGAEGGARGDGARSPLRAADQGQPLVSPDSKPSAKTNPAASNE